MEKTFFKLKFISSLLYLIKDLYLDNQISNNLVKIISGF
jgi:hypothetical protein